MSSDDRAIGLLATHEYGYDEAEGEWRRLRGMNVRLTLDEEFGPHIHRDVALREALEFLRRAGSTPLMRMISVSGQLIVVEVHALLLAPPCAPRHLDLLDAEARR